ncbi:Replication protein C [Pseudooceanicola batsensis HTCC2597]|uniref:Replication protein C n=1 Tax=Pseudooceanicola batsensis (strain ATCC BAA-863 / DSM 15984 / KCTC 12145 / HTCC2597) TaxID=252305 RepID=A3U124_PSEBH|nr:Replication protein C [Pseudooceanicola batsensis HTCC2597]
MTTTPFGARPVTACLVDHHARGQGPAPVSEVDKWEVLNALSLCGRDYGLGDRTIGVLQVLLSFHPDRVLRDGQPLVVFASNLAICQRAHGMPESTLRRHIAALVGAGVILRHDSPNGKRYARRGQGGQITRAFGFDLRPLLVMARELAERAAEEQARRDRLKTLREEVSLMLRDAVKLILFAQESGRGGHWDALDDRAQLARRYLRRKLSEDQLISMHDDMTDLLAQIRARTGVDNPAENVVEIAPKTEEMSGSAGKNERHYQTSEKEASDRTPPPLGQVLDACPDVLPYLDRRITGWNDFVQAICRVAPMTGIDARTWAEGCRHMGSENAAATVAGIVQRIGQIANPGAYFRTLARKAEQGNYSPHSLLGPLERQAA